MQKKVIIVLTSVLLFTYQVSIPSISSGQMYKKLEIPTRSLDAPVLAEAVTFDKNAFASENFYFLGANNTDKNEYSLSLATLYTDTTVTPNETKCKFSGIAPETTYVNQASATGEKQVNPIYNADVKHLTLMGAFPIVVLGTRNPNYTHADTAGVNQTICFLDDRIAGSIINVNEVKLTDSGGDTNYTSSIAGLAASTNRIFAAVAPSESSGIFGDTGSGIAVVKHSDNKLIPIDATTGESGNKAQALPSQTNITTNNHITIHWDSTLSRLFVGLYLQRDSGNASFCSLLVGRISNDILTLEKIVNPDNVPEDVLTPIIAGKNRDSDTYNIIHHIKTMHTSTGKSYVIINSELSSSDPSSVKNKVYALPIAHKTYNDDTTPSDANIGKITKKADSTQKEIVTQGSEMTINTNATAHVGGGDEESDVNETPSSIENMFVVGDSLFICCAGTNGNQKGIFYSTAIFDENGLIRTWTPWQRTMGVTDKVHGGILNYTSGNYWYLTKTTNEWDTVKVTQWAKHTNDPLVELRSTLGTEFTQANGGVHQIFDFDEQTTGFTSNEFSMMVATGYKKVTLIQTGEDSTGFIPVLNSEIVDSDHLKTYATTDIQELGSICCAEVSRSNLADKGWLFVGGYNGVAVLRKSDGKGWNASTGLSALTTLDSNYSFKKIGNFSNVIKLICNGTYLYILTPNYLYRIEMAKEKFDDSETTALNESDNIIASTTYLSLNTNASFLDFIISGKLGLIATTEGLYRTKNTSNSGDISGSLTQARNWTEVKTTIDSTEYSLGTVTHLCPISLTKGSFSTGGNLYVLAGNISKDLSTIFRFNVTNASTTIDNDTVKPIAEIKAASTDSDRAHFYAIGKFRSAFVTDGSLGFHSLPKHFGQTDYLRKINMLSNSNSIRINDTIINLDYESSAYNIGMPVKNTASGIWVIPGDWSIRANE